MNHEPECTCTCCRDPHLHPSLRRRSLSPERIRELLAQHPVIRPSGAEIEQELERQSSQYAGVGVDADGDTQRQIQTWGVGSKPARRCGYTDNPAVRTGTPATNSIEQELARQAEGRHEQIPDIQSDGRVECGLPVRIVAGKSDDIPRGGRVVSANVAQQDMLNGQAESGGAR